VRLAGAVCMLLSNMRMLVGVVVQKLLFGKSYSPSQLVAVVVVTAGIAWASSAMQQAKAKSQPGSGSAGDFLIGVVEMVFSSLSLALMSSTVKIAFARFGESVEEQIFMQHLLSIPLVFPSQWQKVGPRLAAWTAQREPWLLGNLAASVLLTFAARSASARMAGRAPNLLTAQLVQTIECFLQIFVVAFMRVPPFPPLGFWGGTLVLVLGTLEYLRASDDSSKER